MTVLTVTPQSLVPFVRNSRIDYTLHDLKLSWWQYKVIWSMWSCFTFQRPFLSPSSATTDFCGWYSYMCRTYALHLILMAQPVCPAYILPHSWGIQYMLQTQRTRPSSTGLSWAFLLRPVPQYCLSDCPPFPMLSGLGQMTALCMNIVCKHNSHHINPWW